MRRAGLIAALPLAAVLMAAKAPPEWPAGIYGNVRLSPVTGDLGGLETRFYEEAGRHMVEVVMCEGWCNRAYKVPVARQGDRFVFDTPEGFRFVVRPRGKTLQAQGYIGEQKLDGKPDRLKRLPQMFGISVANDHGGQ